MRIEKVRTKKTRAKKNIPSFNQDTVPDSANVSLALSDMGPPSSFGMGDIPQLRRGRTSSIAQRKRERGEEEGNNEGSRKRR